MFEDRNQLYGFGVDLSNSNSPTTKFVQMIPRRSRVLEVGCGSGFVSAYLTREMDCDVVGIELNPEAARLAEQYCSQVIVGDVEGGVLDELRDRRFDVITFGDVLEHLVLPGRVLSRSAELLSDEGFVLISIPNVAHYSVRLRLLLGRFDYTHDGLLDHTHLRFFTLQTATKMILDAGFLISDFDVVWIVKGQRYISRFPFAARFLKKYFQELVAFQFIFKIVRNREPGERVDEPVISDGKAGLVNRRTLPRLRQPA